MFFRSMTYFYCMNHDIFQAEEIETHYSIIPLFHHSNCLSEAKFNLMDKFNSFHFLTPIKTF